MTSAAPPPEPAVAWTGGGVHPEVLVGVALVALAYLAAWRLRGERLDRGRAVAFFAGLAVVVGATNGPLHELSERYLFTAHMVQHLLLTLAVPPLILAGTPSFMADALLGVLTAPRPLRAVVLTVTRPLPALALYAVALFVWHLPGPYDAALSSDAWHAFEHVVLTGTAFAAWWPILSPSRLAPRLPYGAQILYLFVFGMPMTIVAAMITAADDLLYAAYAAAPRITALGPFEDQRLGGVIMWVPAGVIPLVAFTIVFFRWVAAEPEDPIPGDETGAAPTGKPTAIDPPRAFTR